MPSTTIRSIFSLAWPMAMNSVVFGSAIVIDTILISPLGEVTLAAMGLASALAGLLLGLVFAFSNGTQILVAQAFGADDKKALKTAYWSSVSILFITAIIGLLFVYYFGVRAIEYFAETQEMANLAWSYLSIISIVVIARAFSQPVVVFFNGCGNTRIPLYSTIIEIPLNAILSLLLVYGLLGLPKMGLAGAAIGSAIAVCVKSIFLLVAMYRYNKNTLQISGWSRITLVKSIQHHFLHAVPLAGTFISMTMAKNVCMLIYAKLGVYQFAALTLMLPWVNIISSIMFAWTNATGILVGQKLGRGDSEDSLDSFISIAWRVAFVLAFIVASLYVLTSLVIPNVYTSLQPETVNTLWSFMPILCILPFTKISNAVCGNVLRAGGEATRAMNIHVAAQWGVLVPLTAYFVFILKLSAVWVFALLVVEELVKLYPFHRSVYSGKWKRNLVKDDSR